MSTKTIRHCEIYFKQGTGWVGRVSESDDRFNLITFKLVTLIGESVKEIRFMAHGQYGVPYSNMTTA